MSTDGSRPPENPDVPGGDPSGAADGNMSGAADGNMSGAADGNMEIPDDMVGAQDVDEAFAAYANRAKKRKKFHLPGEDVNGLNLTAMMDMMTILLVFLLKSYASEPDKLQVNDKMRPPTSTIEERIEPAIMMVVTADEILVDDLRVMAVKDVSLQGTGQQMAVTPVFEALSRRVDHMKKLEELGGAPFDGKLLIVAHESTPYALISAMLYTAGQAQMSRFRLVVMDDGKEG
jgi:biopolymer transport protein ExbD